MTARLDAVDAAASPAQVAANVSLKFVGSDIFVLHSEDRRQLERKFAGIDFVEGAVNDVDFNVDDRITTQHAVEYRFLDSFFYGRNVFARNDAADDFVLDDKTFTALGWAHVHFHVSILAAAA